MLLKKHQVVYLLAACLCLGLQGCDKSSSEKKVVIKPAPKLTNDATAYAQKAWVLINQVEPIVAEKQLAKIEPDVRKPLRELGIQWRVNVKMTDSVTEGQYALCRKALTSLDSWATATLNQDSGIQDAHAEYSRDKALCKNAIDHPNLGNTPAN
ncbi:hypothetical protein [Acinetobacter sp. MB5]|uniref:hypothetical protein n=1 Tax=Acinetobacter sp. MB5 TaxID=2069438 RepID=UPI000DCFDC8D|nr:hypothetical protein [Acinetobacter sp. MB5]